MKFNRRKVLYLVLCILLVALATCTLSACSFLGGLFEDAHDGKVTSVSIVLDGLEEKDGALYAEVGKTFTLSAKLNEDAPEKPKYKWYVSVDGETPKTIAGENGNAISITYDAFDEKTREYTLSADSVKSSNSVTVKMKYSVGVANAEIISNPPAVSGTIQQRPDEISPVNLTAKWNESALSPDVNVTISWFINDGATPESNEKTFVFTPPAEEGNTRIILVLFDGKNVARATLTISVRQEYDPVDEVSVNMVSGGTPFGDLVQYKQIGDVISPVTLSADVYPESADLSKPVVWTIEDRNGTRTLSDNGNTVTFTPAYGETYVTATVDNVESRHLVFIALTAYDYEKHSEAIEYTYVWEKGVYNSYIMNDYDMGVFVAHMESQRKTASNKNDDGAYLCMPSSGYDILDGNSLKVNFTLIDTSGKFSIGASYDKSANKYWLFFDKETTFNTPARDYSPAEEVLQEDNVILNFSALSDEDKRTSIPADDFPTYPEVINNSDTLYKALSWGYKPTFASDAQGAKLKSLYESARKTLLDYISDDMSDVEKVTVIYEWIAQSVYYDYAIVASTISDLEKLTYNAFSLEGVFLDENGDGYGQAVCDGRAKAFVLLCGMEGIKAIRIRGTAYINGNTEGHAWNKVFIDADDDGVKEWYMLDTTWSDRGAMVPIKETLNHQFFLVTDEVTRTTHVSDGYSYNPVANTEYDYYKNTFVGEGDEKFSLYVNNSNDLKKALDYSKAHGVYVELKFNPAFISSEAMLRKELVGRSFTYQALEKGKSYLILIF